MRGKLLGVALVGLMAAGVKAGPISYTTAGSTYSENFDGLASSGTANTWTDGVTVTGWYAANGSPVGPVTTYAAGTGSSASGGIYSFGSSGSGERALGSLSSGNTGTQYYGVIIRNDTAQTLNTITISYRGEEWRATGTVTSATTVTNSLRFEYSTTASTIYDSGFTAVPSLDFTAPAGGPTFALSDQSVDGNSSTYSTSISGSFSISGLAPNAQIVLRWNDINDAGNDQGLSIDDFSFSATGSPVVPLPAASVAGLSLLGGLALRRSR